MYTFAIKYSVCHGLSSCSMILRSIFHIFREVEIAPSLTDVEIIIVTTRMTTAANIH